LLHADATRRRGSSAVPPDCGSRGKEEECNIAAGALAMAARAREGGDRRRERHTESQKKKIVNGGTFLKLGLFFLI
jgi:hypothetical protein